MLEICQIILTYRLSKHEKTDSDIYIMSYFCPLFDIMNNINIIVVLIVMLFFKESLRVIIIFFIYGKFEMRMLFIVSLSNK